MTGNGEVITREAENFKLNKKLNNWKFDLGSKFNKSGTVYSIAGYNPKVRKYPFIVSSRGKMYKMSESMINHYLG